MIILFWQTWERNKVGCWKLLLKADSIQKNDYQESKTQKQIEQNQNQRLAFYDSLKKIRVVMLLQISDWLPFKQIT